MARKRAIGEGTIIYNERRERWEGKFPYKDKNDKSKRKNFTGKTQKEVAAKGKAFLKSLENGLLAESDKITVGEWLERWLEDYARPNVAIGTYEKYFKDMHDYIIPRLGRILLNKLKAPDVQRAFNEILVSGRKRPRKGETESGLSTSIVRTARRCFTSALEKAFEVGLIAKNVAKQTKPPKLVKKEIRPLSDQQAKDLLEIAKKGEYMPKAYYSIYDTYSVDYGREMAYMVVLLTLNTGMRRGEVLGLRWDDFSGGRVSIKRSLIVSKTMGAMFQDTKTKGSKRTIPIPEFVIKALERYKKIQNWYMHLMGDKYEDTTGLIFTNYIGKPLNGSSFVSRYYKRMLAKAEIDHSFTFHDLRHTHATLLLKQGVNIKVISERLGHTTVAMTLDTYSHLMPDMQKTAVNALDKLFGMTAGGQ